MREILKKLGFSEKEIDVYLSAFKLGSGPISLLAKQAKIKRPTVYVILDKFNRLGLVTLEKKGIKQIFIAQSPQRLVALIEQKKMALEVKAEKIKKALPQFNILVKQNATVPNIRYFEGIKGAWSIIDDLTDSGTESAWVIAPDKSYDIFGQERFIKNVILKRKKLGIKMHVIIDQHPKMVELYREWIKEKDIEIKEYRIFPANIQLDTLFYIYKNKVSLIFLREVPSGIIIENEKLFKVMKFMFNSLWKGLEGNNLPKI